MNSIQVPSRILFSDPFKQWELKLRDPDLQILQNFLALIAAEGTIFNAESREHGLYQATLSPSLKLLFAIVIDDHTTKVLLMPNDEPKARELMKTYDVFLGEMKQLKILHEGQKIQ